MIAVNLLINERKKLEQEISSLEKENRILREQLNKTKGKITSYFDLCDDCLIVGFMVNGTVADSKKFTLAELENIVNKIKF